MKLDAATQLVILGAVLGLISNVILSFLEFWREKRQKRKSETISGIIYIPTPDEVRKYSRPWPYRELIKSHAEPITEKDHDSAHSHYAFKKGGINRSLKIALIMISVGAVLVLIIIWIASRLDNYGPAIEIGGGLFYNWNSWQFVPLFLIVDSAVKIITMIILLISATSAFCLSRASVLLIRLRKNQNRN